MKKFLFYSLFLVSLKATCQNLLLSDTAMLKALSPDGYRDPKIILKILLLYRRLVKFIQEIAWKIKSLS